MRHRQTTRVQHSSDMSTDLGPRFVKAASNEVRYDLLVMDVFDGQGETPEAFLTEDFGVLPHRRAVLHRGDVVRFGRGGSTRKLGKSPKGADRDGFKGATGAGARDPREFPKQFYHFK